MIILGDYLRISNQDIQEVIGSGVCQPNPDKLIELLDSTELGDGRRTSAPSERWSLIKQWLIRQLKQFRDVNPKGWLERIDWEQLHRSIPSDSELVSATFNRSLVRLVQKLDIDRLVENTCRVLQQEYEVRSDVHDRGISFEQWLDQHAEHELLRQLEEEIKRMKLSTVHVLELMGEENMLPKLTQKLIDKLLDDEQPETKQALEQRLRKTNLELSPIEQYLVSFLFYREFNLLRVVTQLYMDPAFQLYMKEHYEKVMDWAAVLNTRFSIDKDPARISRIPAEQLLDAARSVGLPDPLEQ
jgi:hypothetical protein